MNPKHWRKMTWSIVLFTAVMTLWMVRVANRDPEVGGFGVPFLFCVWSLGFVVLGSAWLLSRPTRRLCPVCGETARKGGACGKCGFDFATAMTPIAGR